MKDFLYLLFSDIRKLITRHTSIFCVIVASLFLSGMAVGIYYQMSAQVNAAQERLNGSKRSIELQSGSYMLDAAKLYENTIKYLEDSDNPADMVTAISYDVGDFDIVGSAGLAVPFTMDYGEEYYDKELSTGEVIVPNSFAQKRVPEGEVASSMIGEEVMVFGSPFTIVGIYDDFLYDATLMDTKRISRADLEVSGEGVSVSDEIVERECAGVYIPMQDYAQMGLQTRAYRIRFSKTLSNSQMESTKKEIFFTSVFDAMGQEYSQENLDSIFRSEQGYVFADLNRTTSVFSTQYISQIIIYIAAIAISLFNILSLYVAVADMSETQNKVFYLCGITAKIRMGLLILELLIYSVVFTALGLLASIWFVMNTDFVEWVTQPEFLPYFMLVMGLSVCIIAVTLPGFYRSVKKTEREGER